MDPKEVAARAAVAYVQDGMKLGLGTGSTAVHFLHFDTVNWSTSIL